MTYYFKAQLATGKWSFKYYQMASCQLSWIWSSSHSFMSLKFNLIHLDSEPRCRFESYIRHQNKCKRRVLIFNIKGRFKQKHQKSWVLIHSNLNCLLSLRGLANFHRCSQQNEYGKLIPNKRPATDSSSLWYWDWNCRWFTIYAPIHIL